MENGNTCPLTQKHLVQLDWVSKEDGSHILTVAVGSRVLLFTPVSSDLAQANLKVTKKIFLLYMIKIYVLVTLKCYS